MAFWKKSNDQNKEEITLQNPSIKENEKKHNKSNSSQLQSNTDDTSQESSFDKVISQFEPVKSALSEGTIVQGKLTFDTPVTIEGKLIGEIYSTSALIIGKTGEIDADIQAERLIVFGKVKGKITVDKKTEIYKDALLEGELNTNMLYLEEGGFFNGKCKMSARSNEKTHITKEKNTNSIAEIH